MIDWTIFGGATLAASALVAVVAYAVAHRIRARAAEPDAWTVMAAILVSLAVLLGASKLAVVVNALYLRAGIDPGLALEGQFRTLAFAASFVPIAAYVLTFLYVVKRGQGARG